MSDTTRKRRELLHAGYEAALESWRASSAGVCPACHDAGTIWHEDEPLPCPYCRLGEARKAASS